MASVARNAPATTSSPTPSRNTPRGMASPPSSLVPIVLARPLIAIAERVECPDGKPGEAEHEESGGAPEASRPPPRRGQGDDGVYDAEGEQEQPPDEFRHGNALGQFTPGAYSASASCQPISSKPGSRPCVSRNVSAHQAGESSSSIK